MITPYLTGTVEPDKVLFRNFDRDFKIFDIEEPQFLHRKA